MGISRSPNSECDRPSADSMMNRFISAMPSSMMLTLGGEVPVEGRGDAFAAEHVRHLLTREEPACGSPRRRDSSTRSRPGEVVTMRLASSLSPLAISWRMSPKPCCVDIARLGVDRQRVPAPAMAGDLRNGGALRLHEGHLGSRKRCSVSGRRRQAFEGLPFVAGTHRHPLAEGSRPAPASSSPAWLSLWPASGRPMPLDRVGDEADRPVVRPRPRAKALEQARRDRGRRDCPSARRVRHPSAGRSARRRRPGRQARRVRRLRQAAPPWNVSAE